MTQEKKNEQDLGTPQFAVVSQFLKDLSFECPKGPVEVNEKEMEMDVSVGLSTKVLKDDVFSVVLKLTAEAKEQGSVVFLADIEYAGHFVIKNIPAEQQDILLGVDAPSLLFPFARKILMSAITDAGFRSPQIEPINFGHLYMQARSQKQQSPAENKKIEKKD